MIRQEMSQKEESFSEPVKGLCLWLAPGTAQNPERVQELTGSPPVRPCQLTGSEKKGGKF